MESHLLQARVCRVLKHCTGLAYFVLFSTLTILVPRIHAQVVTGTLTGTVMDQTGATVPNAAVTLTDQSTQASQSTKTTSNGIYNVPYVKPGLYRVTVEA